MGCTYNDFTIQGDVKNRLKASVVRVAGHDTTIQQILAGYFGTEEFAQYIEQNGETRDYLSINANTLRRLLGSFFVSRHNTINHSINVKQAAALRGFSSEKAKSIAKDHTANLIIESYYSELVKPKGERITKDQIIKNVSKSINAKFNNVAKALISKSTTDGVNDANFEKVAELSTQIDEAFDNYDQYYDLLDEAVDEATEDALNAQLDEIDEKINKLETQRYVLYKNIIDKHGNIREKNYANLNSKIRGDANEWYQSAFQASKLSNLVNEFNVTLESDKIIERNYADENDIINPDTDSVDEMAKSWEDSLYGSFDRHVGTKLKVYLNRLYHLATPNTDGSNEYNYDTNNELGVPMTIGANFIIAQITNYANFYSVDEFTESINRVSKINPALYGLSKLVNDMKVNREFANEVFEQLANPKIAKTIVTISENTIDFKQSNNNADALTYLVFSLLNSVKATYKNSFSNEERDQVKNNIISLTKVKDANVFRNGVQIQNLDKFIDNTLVKYFPKIDKNGIRNYLYGGTDIVGNYTNLLQDLSELMSRTEDVIDDYNTKWGNYLTEFKAWSKKRDIAQEIGEIYKTPMPVFDYSTIDYSRLESPIINLSKKLVNYTSVKNELNSVNAEGNMSSDLIGNSYITNFLKQLQYGNVDSSEAGLERLKEFVTKSPQYQYSPIFFGVKDANGNILQNGLFIRNNSGKVTVSPNARNMITMSLFDGAKDRVNGNSTMYSGMSKGDYFLTQLLAFNNPIKDVTIANSEVGKAGYFMRTPSDAPKNFIFQAPKYNTNSLWRVVPQSVNNYINEVQEELAAKFNFTNEGEFLDLSDDIIDGSVRGKIDNNHVTAEQMYDMFKNPIENKSYSNLYHTYNEETNEVVIPLIYEKDGNKLIAYLKGTKVVGTINNIVENLNIVEVHNPVILQKGVLPNDFIIDIRQTLENNGIDEGRIERIVDKNNAAFRALHAHTLGEINNFVSNLNNVFEKKGGKWVSKTDTTNLIERAHYNGDIVQDGKLTGNMFNIIRLFETNGYKAGEELMQGLSLYGQTNENGLESLLQNGKGGKLNLNTDRIDIINTANGTIELNMSTENLEAINNVVEQWLNNFYKEVLARTAQYNTILDNAYSTNDIVDFAINNAIMEMNFDDVFEGDTKFYKSAQDFLKRAKEVQAAGKAYAGFSFNDAIGAPVHNIKDSAGAEIEIVLKNGTTMKARNGFKAVTINNTVRASESAPAIKQELIDILSAELGSKEATRIATDIASGYFEATKTNDAQSYITIEEFIRRRFADGTLNEYQDLLSQLLDDKIMPQDIDLKGINARIQVQKNFYFDKQFDSRTGVYYPRQIKNAEFVLIPKLIKGTSLEQLYNVMKSNSIDQVNTAETSKAAKKNVLTFWDHKGVANVEAFNEAVNANGQVAIEDYYYQYLYKQQNVADHIVDEHNKAGIQVMKKLIDNASPAVQKDITNFFNSYVANIQDDFNMLLNRMGWKVGSDGKLQDGKGRVNGDNQPVLQFDDFYKKARVEAQRLGMDSNFIEYLTPDVFGQPTMPNYMNNVSSKLESIAQSIFNNGITRQTLPGWHAAQVTTVGHGVKVLGEDGKFRELKYHPKVTDAEGNTIQEAYAEAMIPRWSKLIPKDYDLSKLESEGLDIHLGYRIPTEGKQSVTIIKVVGFLDEIYGSTVMMPDEWVTQTGSDFDVDSVYGISYEMYKDKETDTVKKVKFDSNTSEEAARNRYVKHIRTLLKDRQNVELIYDEFKVDDIKEVLSRLGVANVDGIAKRMNLIPFKEYYTWSIEAQNTRQARNNRILDSMVNIMNNENSREENYSRSNFDDLTKAMKKMNSLRGASSVVRSSYNPLDQIDFMENAMSGATLKAFSVSRDTFNSVNNYIKSKLGEGHEITVEYDLNDYNINHIRNAYDEVQFDQTRNVAIVNHNRLANSNNNRNVVGKLLTVYSSQTTAHILDAVKEGTIFNENDFTFGTFKTLIDVGIDYDTAVGFLMQPAVSRIVAANSETKSIYINATTNAIDTAIKSLATDMGITIGGRAINAYTPIKSVINRLSADKNLQMGFRELFAVNISYSNDVSKLNVPLNSKMLQNRLNGAEISNNLELREDTKQYRDYAFDLAMIMNFKKYNNTTRNIEALGRVSNPDRFGAKQTIRGTRVTLNNIEKYMNDPSDEVGTTIEVKGVRMLKSLYPGYNTNLGIQVQDSSYPYLAAFLKFATQPSVEANSQLFPTEGKLFNAVTDTVQSKLGISFTDEQYKEYKQYMMSNVYSSVHFLNTPLTLNEYGLVTLDVESIEEHAEGNKFYWDQERARIFGYDTTESSSLELSDINNPTAEDINRFNKLTPAQKVMFIQRSFNEGRGIFEYLDVNTFNQYEYKQRGFSSQSIKYSDQVDNIEEVYLAFRDSFFNKNALVRLAAVDLVKYAFVAEGFKFKRGGISKIITNDALYSNLEDKGMNVIEAIQQQFMVYTNPLDGATTKFIDKFVRSHSEIVKEVSIPKPKLDNQKNPNIGTKFARQLQTEGIVYIPFQESNKELLEHLTLVENNLKDFIRVNRYLNNKQKVSTLYKVKNDGRGVYLLPLNLLERNETSEYSVNHANNRFKAYDYYDAISNMATDNNVTINELLADGTNTLEETKILKAQFTIEKHKSPRIIESVENPNELIRILNSGTVIQRAEITKLVSDVSNYISLPVEEAGSFGVIRNDNPYIAAVIPAGGSIIQNIPIGEDVVTVKLSKYKPTKEFVKVIRQDTRADITKVRSEELDALNNAINAKSKYPNLYKIERVNDQETREEYEAMKLLVEEEAASQMNAITNLIQDFDVDVAFNYTDTDKVAKDIFNELNKRALSNNDRGAAKFKNIMDKTGVDRSSQISIHDNKRNIFTNASKYYIERSHEMLSNIDKFTGVNGEQYSIDDPALYKHLTEFPEDYPLLVKLILDAKTFGEQFYDIFNINITGEDEITSKAIDRMRDAINNVRTSSKLKNAVNLLFNDYIANNFSSNPLIRQGIVELKTQFGDTDWFDLTFSDIGELNHKQIQTITKYVYSILNEATMEIAPRAVEAFNKRYEEIENTAGDFNMDNIITKEGKFVSPYTEKFLEDREKVVNAVRDAKETHGPDSIQYHKAKLERNKWRAKNIEQEIVSPYYNANNDLLEKVLNSAPNEYLQYMALVNELYADKTPTNKLSLVEKEKRKELSAKIKALTNEFSLDGTVKSDEQRYRAGRLKAYIDGKKELNKEYFNFDESDGFVETLEYYRIIVKQYEKQRPLETLDQKLNDPNYREAYEWIQGNTIYTLDDATQKTINEAFKALKSEDNNNNRVVKQILKDADAFDEFGNVDPRKLSPEQLAIIKKTTEHKFSWTYESNAGEAILIKDVPAGLPVLKDSFYRMLRADSENATGVNAERIRIIGEINKMLGDAIDVNTGEINSKDLFEKYTEAELKHLGDLYSMLHAIKGNRDKDFARKFVANVDFLTHDDAFNRNWSYAQSNLKGTKQYDIWLDIFIQKDKDGVFVTNEQGKFVPNNDIFGYILPKDKTYIDQEKTDARNTVQNDLEYNPTEYYYAARREASNNGTFDEWYKANHVFNPYSHKMEPLKVWTTMNVNPNGNLKGTYSFAPTYENTERTVKDEYVNHKSKQYSTNYNSDNGVYNNLNNLTPKEKEMLNLLQSTVNANATTHGMRMFAEKGFIPRRAVYKPDTKFYVGEALGSVGLEFRNTGEQQWTDKLDYVNDFDADFDMLSLIKQKGYQQRIQTGSIGTNEKPEEYAARIESDRFKNKMIDADNLRLDNELLDRDYKNVFSDFIAKATEYDAKQRVKNTVYLLLEDLKDTPAYKEGAWGRNLKRDGSRSTKEADAYQTVSQANSYALTQNWARRVLFNQFKKGSPYSKYADLAQNITSAKYMIANVTGGFANVGTGMTNVFGEVFAGDYFNKKAFAEGQAQYFKNSLSFISDMYKDTTNNPTVGIAKYFSVVDFDAFNERRPNEKASERVKRVRDSLYAMQSGGEHYMQNSVLFALLKSHRVFKDTDGQMRVGNINNYNWEVEIQTMMGMLNGRDDLLTSYKSFIKDVKSDMNELRKYDSFNKDFNEEFLRDIGDKNLIQEYITNRTKALDKAKEDFAKHPLAEDQFDLVDGVTRLKEGSPMTKFMVGELRQKVIAVNKKIHGVYDKIGAASIEKEWWGGLVMQYHKHIYPGIMKRYRMKGYYNEARSSIEKGSYVSLADYLSKEFRGIKKRINNRTEVDNENVALASFQEIIKASMDTVINFKLNYQLMPVWEQNNMRRALGDLLGITGAFMTAIAIHLMTDDDEIKDSETLASVLYMADRINSESAMYTPWGLFAEAGTLWSSPIAAQNGPKDLFKALGIATGMLFDAEYNPNYTTGLYKGQNKLAVLAYRNTPIYRVYQRLSNMTKNNNYYKLNENALNIKYARTIADSINPD